MICELRYNLSQRRSIENSFFSRYLCYRKLLSLLSPYYFHRCMHYFCLHELFYYFLWTITQPAYKLTSIFITLFGECFSAFFKNITHAFYKQKCPCRKRDETFIWEKTSHQSEIPVLWKWNPCYVGEFIFISTDFDFSIEFFYKVRSRLTEALTLPGCFFSI